MIPATTLTTSAGESGSGAAIVNGGRSGAMTIAIVNVETFGEKSESWSSSADTLKKSVDGTKKLSAGKNNSGAHRAAIPAGLRVGTNAAIRSVGAAVKTSVLQMATPAFVFAS